MKNTLIKQIKKMQSNEGASSVLVIFMLLILVSLGSFAIASANVNYRLNQKTVHWRQEYYQLDATAEEFIADTDKLLHQAETFAIEYIANQEYLNENYNILPFEIQNYFISEWNNASDKEVFLDNLLKKLYSFYFFMHIDELLNLYPKTGIYYNGYTVEIDKNYEFIFEPIDFFPIIMENIVNIGEVSEDSNSNIIVALQINIPEYSFNYHENEITATRMAKKRYEILQWTQENEPFHYEDTMQLWDGDVMNFVD